MWLFICLECVVQAWKKLKVKGNVAVDVWENGMQEGEGKGVCAGNRTECTQVNIMNCFLDGWRETEADLSEPANVSAHKRNTHTLHCDHARACVHAKP